MSPSPIDEKPVVLAIDDDPMFQRLYRRLLEREYTVIVASDAAEAKTLFAASNVWAVVMDGMLRPLENFSNEHFGSDDFSYGLTRWMREQGFTGPIIATSTHDGVRRKQLEAGCDHAVEDKAQVKPCLNALRNR